MFAGDTRAEFFQAIKAIRALGYDTAVDFQGAIKSAVLSSFSGAKSKAGFTDPRESPARLFYSSRFSRAGDHVIEQNHALAMQALKQHLGQNQRRQNQNESGINLLAPELPKDDAAAAWAQGEIQRLGIASFIIINPGAGWGAKQWPPERYGAVARALAVHGLKTLVNTAPGEEALAAAVVQASGGNAFELRCTVGQLIALTRRARLLVGGDTGPVHLAAALGIPVVALFGPTDPARTGPYGTRSVVLRNLESKTTTSHYADAEEGLLKISTDEVISAARWLLGGSHA